MLCIASPPSRGRGLKLIVAAREKVAHVAPLAGAWIETKAHGYHVGSVAVAPLAGAWIETPYSPHQK